MIVKLAIPNTMAASSLAAIIRGEGQALHPLVYWLNEQVHPDQRSRAGGKQFYQVDIPRAQLTRELADYMIGLGGDVHGMPFFFEIDLTRRIPARLRTDANDMRTWTDWFATSQTMQPFPINDKWYTGTNVFGAGDYLPAERAINWATNTSTVLIALKDLPVQQVLA